MFIFRSLLILVLLVACVAPAPVELRGMARVVDGDTIAIDGVNMRLFGIDAPERAQTCTRRGVDWACGAFARDVLAARLAGAEVTCDVRGQADKYGRPVVICRAGGEDLGAFLVRAGAALAYRRYSDRYVAAEAVARQAGIGVWAGSMVSPESFRHRDAPEVADGCDIKGNISRGGRIFHAPGQRDYARTQINPAKGEGWFCTPADAKAAGFRPARR